MVSLESDVLRRIIHEEDIHAGLEIRAGDRDLGAALIRSDQRGDRRDRLRGNGERLRRPLLLDIHARGPEGVRADP